MNRLFLTTLAAAFSLPSFADDHSFTLGVDTRCIYGLGPCWGKVREPVSLVEGVESVGDVADAAAWTGTFKTAGGKLPNVERIKALMQQFNGDQFTYRGLEATLPGKVTRTGGRLFLTTEAGETLRLESLKKKVQFDVKKHVLFPASAPEKTAHARLNAHIKKTARPAKLTGPVRFEGGVWKMEVREFAWR